MICILIFYDILIILSLHFKYLSCKKTSNRSTFDLIFLAQEPSPRTQSLIDQLKADEESKKAVPPGARTATTFPEPVDTFSKMPAETETTDLDASTDFFNFKKKDNNTPADPLTFMSTQSDYKIPEPVIDKPAIVSTAPQSTGPTSTSDQLMTTNMYTGMTLPATQPSPQQQTLLRQQQLRQQQMMKQFQQQQQQFRRQQQQQLQQLQQQMQEPILPDSQVQCCLSTRQLDNVFILLYTICLFMKRDIHEFSKICLEPGMENMLL